MNRNLSTRRIFLQKGLTLLAVAPTIPTFLDQTVLALTNPEDVARTQQASGKDGKILVVVQLSGGNDGLNTVVPYADDTYHRVRPQLGHDPKTVLKINDYIGLHPSLAPLKSLYDDGMMSIIQGVGYPNPNRSHFRSMDIWQSGQPTNEQPTSGWLGRYFDNTCSGCDPHVGVAIGGQQPMAVKGERVSALTFERPESYRYSGRDQDRYLKLNGATTRPSANIAGDAPPEPVVRLDKNRTIEITPASQLDFLHRTAMDAQVSSDDIMRMTSDSAVISRLNTPTGSFRFTATFSAMFIASDVLPMLGRAAITIISPA